MRYYEITEYGDWQNRPDRKQSAEPWRGPHSSIGHKREIELFFKRKKPAMIISYNDSFNKIKKTLDGLGVPYKDISNTMYPMWVIAQSGEEWRIDALERIYDDVHQRKKKNFKHPMTAFHHAEVGRILGYKDEDINKFIEPYMDSPESVAEDLK